MEILSGVSDGFTNGAPICLLIRNEDVDDTDYEKIRFQLRPGHADYTAFVKYGGFNDWRGGGRFSGRITATFVMAGAIAKKLLELDWRGSRRTYGGNRRYQGETGDYAEIKKKVMKDRSFAPTPRLLKPWPT